MIDEIVKKIKEIDNRFTMRIDDNVIGEGMALTRILVPGSRLGSYVGTNPKKLTLRIGNNEMIGITIGEFYPCCGKVLGNNLRFLPKYYDFDKDPEGKPLEFDEGKLNKAFPLFMQVAEEIIKYCKYTSFSFIVSTKENQKWYDCITKIDTYKNVNEFQNKRMPSKNLCIEYCKNLW